MKYFLKKFFILFSMLIYYGFIIIRQYFIFVTDLKKERTDFSICKT